ncbi:alpha/beta fold hydrolase [Portibacter marinus]|uniref:alpha/beta fold hydrolase n=1 Tax=Portibacter marinus TaxID=2898660 RepID=UPI001F4677F3|nr:alpha/beta hydrolase [Portibacter marinus]
MEIQFYHHGDQKIAFSSKISKSNLAPIILIHGFSASFNFWQIGMEQLAVERTWYQLSLPGHYPSTLPDGFNPATVDINFFNDFLNGFILDIVKSKALLVGHSMGGFVALNYASQFPQHVISVMSISGFLNGNWTGFEGWVQKISQGNLLQSKAFQSAFHMMKRSKLIFKEAALSYAHQALKLRRKEIFNKTIDKMYPLIRKHDIAKLHMIFSQLPSINITDMLRDLKPETWIITGNRDKIIRIEHAMIIDHVIPHSKLLIYDDCGHLPLIEDFERFSQDFGDWLNNFSEIETSI